MHKEIIFPSQVTPEVKLFDRFSRGASNLTSKSGFFIGCVIVILIWLPSYFIIKDSNTWNFIIGTPLSILTLLVAALLSNTQTRDTNGIHHKLNSVALGLSDIADALETILDNEVEKENLRRDIVELRDAVGLEQHESS